MENTEIQYNTNQCPLFIKQLKLFTPDMLFFQGLERNKNKFEIAMEFERFIGLSVSKIRKYTIPSRLDEYDNKQGYGKNRKSNKKRKDDIARIMYGTFRMNDEFLIANRIIIKTHVIYRKYPNDGEHISLPKFDFQDVKYTPWEESDLYDTISNYEFLFLIFENYVDRENERENKNTFFTGMFYGKIKDIYVPEFRRVYELTQKTIWDGIKQWPIINKDGTVKMCPKHKERPVMANNLPKAEDSYVCHVRPHGSSDTQVILDNGDKINPQSFWINKEFVRNMVEENRVHALFEGIMFGN